MIFQKIEKLREKMRKAIEKYGLNHEKSISLSRELDQLLNSYEKERRKQSENK